MILRAYSQIFKNQSLTVFFKDELTLTAYTTTKIDKKKGIKRLPTTGGENMTE